jgi:hypothetical protein
VTDDLARRMADSQTRMAVESLRRDARRLAAAVARLVDQAATGGPVSGDASRIAQEAMQLAQLAARIDGMRDIAGLIAKEDA